MNGNGHIAGGLLAAAGGALASSDELQSLLVALFAIAVRELIYWYTQRRRRKPTVYPGGQP